MAIFSSHFGRGPRAWYLGGSFVATASAGGGRRESFDIASQEQDINNTQGLKQPAKCLARRAVTSRYIHEQSLIFTVVGIQIEL